MAAPLTACMQNNISELFMLLHFLDKAKFASVEGFEAQFSEIEQQEQVTGGVQVQGGAAGEEGEGGVQKT